MRKLSIFLMLALLLGFTSAAQADLQPNGEAYLIDIINNMLIDQELTPIITLPAEQAFETYAPGDYKITYYGKQSGNVQNALYYLKSDLSETPLATFSDALPLTTMTKLANPIAFSPTQEWGLLGKSPTPYYSEASLNSGEVHWKLYCIQGIGFAGFEDLPMSTSDRDYQDLVLKIEPNPPAVPLPGAVLLLGAGLARLAAYARRRQED